jgi:4-hydroxy-tetrahydrodipicolinate synthase
MTQATDHKGAPVTRPALAPGAGVALVSLFAQDGVLLTDETADLAARLVEAGAASVLVAGSTGEFWALEDEERVALASAVRIAVPRDVPVIGHAGGVPVERAEALAVAMADVGVDAVLALPVGIEPEAVVPFYRRIAADVDVPVIAYNFPRLGVDVTLGALAEAGIAAVKDSSGDGSRLAAEVLELGIETYTGAAALVGLAHDLGAAGAMLGVANVHPDLSRDAFAGDREAFRRLARAGLGTAREFPSLLKRQTAERWGTPAFSRSRSPTS